MLLIFTSITQLLILLMKYDIFDISRSQMCRWKSNLKNFHSDNVFQLYVMQILRNSFAMNAENVDWFTFKIAFGNAINWTVSGFKIFSHPHFSLWNSCNSLFTLFLVVILNIYQCTSNYIKSIPWQSRKSNQQILQFENGNKKFPIKLPTVEMSWLFK